MTSDNPVADRLVSDARKKESRASASSLNIAALAISLVSLAAAGWVPLVGVLGLVGAVVGGVSSRKPGSVAMAWGAVAIGILAPIWGVVMYYIHYS
jgi:hypothetical protein